MACETLRSPVPPHHVISSSAAFVILRSGLIGSSYTLGCSSGGCSFTNIILTPNSGQNGSILIFSFFIRGMSGNATGNISFVGSGKAGTPMIRSSSILTWSRYSTSVTPMTFGSSACIYNFSGNSQFLLDGAQVELAPPQSSTYPTPFMGYDMAGRNDSALEFDISDRFCGAFDPTDFWMAARVQLYHIDSPRLTPVFAWRKQNGIGGILLAVNQSHAFVITWNSNSFNANTIFLLNGNVSTGSIWTFVLEINSTVTALYTGSGGVGSVRRSSGPISSIPIDLVDNPYFAVGSRDPGLNKWMLGGPLNLTSSLNGNVFWFMIGTPDLNRQLSKGMLEALPDQVVSFESDRIPSSASYLWTASNTAAEICQYPYVPLPPSPPPSPSPSPS